MKNRHYNQGYTKKDIKCILDIFKDCIVEGRYTISLNDNRRENVRFIKEYNLYREKRENILLGLEVEDFCHSLKNTKVGYEHETLYVFVPQEILINPFTGREIIDIYIKINIISTNKNEEAVVISFHKCNKPVDYAFK